MNTIKEENIEISFYGEKISKELDVFYNPIMKLNRDTSLLLIKSYFEKPILFCDPMIATGIREARFLKTIPEMFEKLVLGDISSTAIKDSKKNFQNNNIDLDKIEFIHNNAITSISSQYFHFIEIDPFGTPVPYIDVALQRIKHRGILSITATDTASLCGTYPKKAKRRYGVDVKLTHFYEELGLRNLIAFVIKSAAKFDKKVNVILSYTKDHYYKVFLQVVDSREDALKDLDKLRYIKINEKTQEIEFSKYRKSGDYLGETYIGKLKEKVIVEKMISNLDLIEDNKKVTKLLNSINDELDEFAYFDIHKLEKTYKISKEMRFKYIIQELEERGFSASKTHNSKFGIKTNAKVGDLIKIIQD